MDALTSLVTALAAGAAAALKPTVEQAVKDSYTALKELIQRKYAQVSLDQLEANPSSKSRRGVVEEDLAAARVDKDAEVLHQAQTLLEPSSVRPLRPPRPSVWTSKTSKGRRSRSGGSPPAAPG